MENKNNSHASVAQPKINNMKIAGKNILLFDVESTSLHGEAFAVGAVVKNLLDGRDIDRFSLIATDVAERASDWVKDNVIPNLNDMPTCKTGKELREAFYNFYLRYKDSCTIWSDVNFPVETNFLSAIVNDDRGTRDFMMPYPLYDVANFVDVTKQRVATVVTRKHHPVDDSICSFYALINSPSFLKLLAQENR